MDAALDEVIYSDNQKKKILFYGLLFSLLAASIRLWNIIPVYALCIIAIFNHKNRFKILTLANVLSFFTMNPFMHRSSFSTAVCTFAIFLVFNIFIVSSTKLFPSLKNKPFISMGFIALSITALIYILIFLNISQPQIFFLVNPVLFSFWSYCSYIRDDLKDHNFFTKILWLRPFWFSWVIPLGNMREVNNVSMRLEPFDSVKARLSIDLKVFAIFIICYTIFENLFFQTTYYTYKIPHFIKLLSLPYTHSQGFAVLMTGHFSRSEAAIAQIFSSIHFLGSAYLFTVSALAGAALSGGLIEPHVKNFWNAKSFTDYYFKIGHHYSILIRGYFIKPLIRKLSFIPNHYVKLFVNIVISVTVVSMISIFIGRGLKMREHFFTIEKNILFLKNYHPSVITAIVCAISQLAINLKFFKRFDIPALQPIRILYYLLISSVLYTFIFNFLFSDFDIRMNFLKFIFIGQ